MPQLAKCPQCQNDLLAPEDVVDGAWVRCPSCWSFFQMKDAVTRALPALEVIEASAPASDAKKNHAAQTVEDITSKATSDDDAADDAVLHETHQVDEIHAAASEAAQELHFADPEIDEAPDMLERHLMLAQDTQPIEAAELDEPTTIPLTSVRQELSDTRTDPLDLAGIEKQSVQPHEALLETPEEAAQRIDAWFRSAKTLEEVPPVSEMHSIDKTAIGGNEINATIDLGSAGIDELALSDDFELEHAAESPSEPVAPWDDSHHMDQLLADIQDQPEHNEFHEEIAETADDIQHHVAVESAEHASEWMPEESLAINPAASSPQRSKSAIRTLVLPAVCGVMGLALGYYVLLWLKGPQIDVLDAAKYLPKAMLPASFASAPRQTAAAPSLPPVADTAADSPANEPNATPTDTANTADAAKPNEAPAEKQASFTEPAGANKAPTADDNRYATTSPPADKSTEPAAFNPPPAAPVTDAPPTPPIEVVRIVGAPSFSASDLAAALVAAKDAEAGLVNGNLADGREVARTKGFSYSILADLAQKATFTDPSAADAENLQQETDNIFRATLATPHARDEVAQIVPKWIASPNRKQGGVFFTGAVAIHDKQGSVVEGSVDMGSGQPLPVLLPPALADKPPTGPVAVVGYVVDKPSERIPGYTGTAPQAVFVTKLIPLQ